MSRPHSFFFFIRFKTKLMGYNELLSSLSSAIAKINPLPGTQQVRDMETEQQTMAQQVKNHSPNTISNQSFNYSKESVFRQFRTSPASHSWEALNSHMWPEKPIQAG